jgi:hypothetical protein
LQWHSNQPDLRVIFEISTPLLPSHPTIGKHLANVWQSNDFDAIYLIAVVWILSVVVNLILVLAAYPFS